jgi:hypothetical protein
MNTEYKTPHEIRTIGFEALLRKLGPAGAIRFLQQYETGRGDYSRDRHTFLPKLSVAEISRQIQRDRKSNPRRS